MCKAHCAEPGLYLFLSVIWKLRLEGMLECGKLYGIKVQMDTRF